MKKRIAKMLKKVAEDQVNADYPNPDIRKILYPKYQRALKNEFRKMSSHDQARFIAENI